MDQTLRRRGPQIGRLACRFVKRPVFLSEKLDPLTQHFRTYPLRSWVMDDSPVDDVPREKYANVPLLCRLMIGREQPSIGCSRLNDWHV